MSEPSRPAGPPPPRGSGSSCSLEEQEGFWSGAWLQQLMSECWHPGDACQQLWVGAGPGSLPQRPNGVTHARAPGRSAWSWGGHLAHIHPCPPGWCLSLSSFARWRCPQPGQHQAPRLGATQPSSAHFRAGVEAQSTVLSKTVRVPGSWGKGGSRMYKEGFSEGEIRRWGRQCQQKRELNPGIMRPLDPRGKAHTEAGPQYGPGGRG